MLSDRVQPYPSQLFRCQLTLTRKSSIAVVVYLLGIGLVFASGINGQEIAESRRLEFANGSPQSLTQAIDFVDGKSITLGNESGFLRIQELVEDEKWLDAAKQAILTMEASKEKLFLWKQSSGCRVFVDGVDRVQFLISSWGKDAPRALEAYRKLVDAEAEVLLEKARQERDIQLLRFVCKNYFNSSLGDDANDQLARIEFESGKFYSATFHWESLINQPDFPGNSSRRYTDTDLSELNLMTDSLAASLLAKDWPQVNKKIRYLESRYSDAQFRFLGRENLGLKELKQIVSDEIKSTNELLPTLATRNQTAIDIRGKATWSCALEVQDQKLDVYQNSFPSIGQPNGATIACFAKFHERFAYWRDEHRIYRYPVQLLNKPGKAESERQDRKLNAGQSSSELVWSTPLPKDTPATSRKRIGRPVFDLEIKERFLFARMGDPRTGYRNDTVTRNRSYLVGLDLDRDGSLLPGFPLQNKDERIEFDATPVYQAGNLFLSHRKTFRDNASCQITLQCRALSWSNRTRELPVVWEKSIVSAKSNSRGVWDEVSASQLLVSGDRIYYVGLGFVLCLHAGTGEVLWVADYLRDRFEFAELERNRSPNPAETVRAKDQILLHQNKVIVAPSDSNSIFCFATESGNCLWRSEFQKASHLLGVVRGTVIASGHHLYWIDLHSGKLRFRFPTGTPETLDGYGLDRTRGIGRADIDRDLLYWPTKDRIFVFQITGDDFLEPKENMSSHSIPRLVRILDLTSRKTTGGNLQVQDGMMLICNEREICCFQE